MRLKKKLFPKIKSQKHEQLLVQYAGDDDALKKIKTAYETDFALYDDANLNINYIKKEINFGRLLLDDLLALKTQLSQETFKSLEDTYNNTISPRSELANNLKASIKSQVYGAKDGFVEIITEEMIGHLNLVMIDKNTIQPLQIVTVLKENHQEEIIIMLQN